MKLLILTQSLDKNDKILGFFHAWVEAFAKECEQVTVIALRVGSYELPKNVKVLSLGKEEGVSRVKYLSRFFRSIVRERNNYDTVFVHMNPIYIVLGGILWKLMGKKVALWYTHREVDCKLRLGVLGADTIFSSTSDSFRITTSKAHFMGHGIDVRFWGSITPEENKKVFTILQVGRITPIKHCELLIEAAAYLKQHGKRPFRVIFLGDPAAVGDDEYFASLRRSVEEKSLSSEVVFAGSGTSIEVRNQYRAAHVTINMLPTGGMDKVVLESLAAGVPALTTNQTWRALFGSYSDTFILPELNPSSGVELGARLLLLSEHDIPLETLKELKTKVTREASHEALVRKMVTILS